MTLRLVTQEDSEAVRGIYRPYVESSAISFETSIPTVEEMSARITSTASTYPWLIAEDGGEVPGYAYAHEFAHRSAYQWSVETSIYLRSDSRGRGIGTTLCGALLELLGEQGFHEAFAGIALPNEASVRLHESMGFEPVALYRRVGWKFDRWRDVQWWQRPLREANGARPLDVLAISELEDSTVTRIVTASQSNQRCGEGG